MDFVVRLPLTHRKNNAIWVIVNRLVNRLTKAAHFIAIKNTWTLNQLAHAYLEEIVRLYRVPNSIVFRDTRFLSSFWQKLQKALSTMFQYSLAPDYGQANRVDHPDLRRYVARLCLKLQEGVGLTIGVNQVLL